MKDRTEIRLSEDNLLKVFEEIHNFIYANDGLSPQQTLDEFLKILFVKLYDEHKSAGKFRITREEYASGSGFRDRISALFAKTKEEYAEIFDADERIRLSDRSLGFSVDKLQHIDFSRSSSDANGLAFQKMLSRHEKEGQGQYFTPSPVVDFCVKMIDPQPGETVIDPCCGSGGFIHSAFLHVFRSGRSKRKKAVADDFYGLDISKNIARIAKMKFLLESNTSDNIHCCNSLEDLGTLRLLLGDRKNIRDGFDILLTNPPFGTAGKITDKALLAGYDLGYKWSSNGGGFCRTTSISNGQPAEILFVERCLDLLKEGGRMAIVLPNGHFENPSLNYLRFYIRQRAELLAVVSLPQETFIPYGTGVKTSLLFLRKKSQAGGGNPTVFFSKVSELGYQGNKNGTPVYRKDARGELLLREGEPVPAEDFSAVLQDYARFKAEGGISAERSYCLNSDALEGRWDFDYYSPGYHALLRKLSVRSKRLGEVAEIVREKSKLLKDKAAEIEYIELSDVNAYSMEIIGSTRYRVHEAPSRATYRIAAGDIITAVAGNSVGTRKHATALVTEEYDRAICTNGFRVLRNPKIDPYYLLYYLKSDLFLAQMLRCRTGAAIPNVSDADFADILVYIPDDKTMEAIGNEVKRSISMRRESVRILESIRLEI